jgi:exonuclease VII large subunit
LNFALKRQLLKEREEHISKLQSKLEEKYQETLTMEKNKWLKEQEADIKQQVENAVILAKTHWDKERKEVWVKIPFSPGLKHIRG